MQFSGAEQIIGQFNDKEIKRILPEIRRQSESKRDFVARAAGLQVDTAGRLIMGNLESFKLADSGNTFLTWAEAEAAAAPGERITPQKANGDFPLTRTAERQLCQRVNVPVDFVDRMRAQGQGELAAHVLTQRLTLPRVGVDAENSSSNGDRFLVRMLDGKVRAMLSDSYRIIDNIDLFYAAAEKLDKVGGDVWQMRLTDDSFQMLAVSRGIAGQVRLDRTYDPGDGWQSRWHNEGGDTQYAAISLSNSETGGGSVRIDPAVMTRVCANFCVWGKALRAVHLQRRREDEGLISAETSAAESRLIWLKVRDAIDTVFDREKFAAYIASLNAATQRNIARDVTDPAQVMEATDRIADKYEISEDRAKSVFAKLMESRDFTQYGLSQAITFQAHGADKTAATDEARELEALGGEIAGMGASEFRDLVKV
jgi:hypothetical protein